MRFSKALILLLLLACPASAQQGYSLISTMQSTDTVLQDLEGNVVRTYHGANKPASIAYLLEDDSILRPCQVTGGYFNSGGKGGRIQRIDADDVVVWDFTMATEDYQLHHDIEPLPNGNVLVIAWEAKTQLEAEAMGSSTTRDEMWSTWVVELQPIGSSDANIVWQWHLWDHLVQDVDPNKPGYATVADHPELFDINFLDVQSTGDWVHMNAIDYNPERDEILIGSRNTNEVYVIDHSTTSTEAAGHSGGTRGLGGDILYRWGNPQAYDRGSSSDQYLSVVHGAVWIDAGLPGEDNILVFNNGDRSGATNDWSSVDEIVPPHNEQGDYLIVTDQPFEPAVPEWSYSDPDNFYGGPTQCGAYRLPDGNTLVCVQGDGYMFEVTSAGEIDWSYTHGSSVARAERYYDYASAVDEMPDNTFAVAIKAWPNPFNPRTTLRFELPKGSNVELGIYDIRGALVRQLINGEAFGEGVHEIVWDGRTGLGRQLESGVYVARVATADAVSVQKLVLHK